MQTTSKLSDVSLELALDSLLSDYLDRIDVLFRAYSAPSPDAAATPTTSEATLLSLHTEAVQRRNLVGLFQTGLHVGSTTAPDDGRRDDDQGTSDRSDLVELHRVLNLTSSEVERWNQWCPEVDETVLVYLSSERGYWPGKVSLPARLVVCLRLQALIECPPTGKIIDLGYFSTLGLPRVPRSRMFAIRIYPTKQRPYVGRPRCACLPRFVH
jgi:hypothetical protein